MSGAAPRRVELTPERFNRLNDRYVKYVFADPKNKALLIALINDVLADIPEGAERIPPVVDLSYRDREAAPTYKGDKVPRFDIVAMTADGQFFHIEFQVAKDPHTLPRVLHYGARNVFMRTREGEEYSSVRVIVIMIANFTLFEDAEGYHTVHRILDVKTLAWHMRGLEFHFIELTKLRARGGEPRSGLERLMYWFGDIGGEEMMETLVKEDTRVARMAQLEDLFRTDPDLLEDYFDQERARMDYEAAMDYSRAEGRAEGEKRGEKRGEERGIKLGRAEGEERGIKLGREEALLNTARRMKAMRMSDEQIAQATCLSLAEVEAL